MIPARCPPLKPLSLLFVAVVSNNLASDGPVIEIDTGPTALASRVVMTAKNDFVARLTTDRLDTWAELSRYTEIWDWPLVPLELCTIKFVNGFEGLKLFEYI